jgi:hypothetical protein
MAKPDSKSASQEPAAAVNGNIANDENIKPVNRCFIFIFSNLGCHRPNAKEPVFVWDDMFYCPLNNIFLFDLHGAAWPSTF